jgi:hypothetical protein
MPLLYTSDLVDALNAQKSILGNPGWQQMQHKSELVASLEGTEFNELTLRIRIKPTDFENAIAAMLEITSDGKARNIARFDWRGNEHGNHLKVCGELQYQDAGPTHFHDPRGLPNVSLDQFFKDFSRLPVAVVVSPEPDNFTNFLEKAGELLHIKGMEGLPKPSWQQSLLPL